MNKQFAELIEVVVDGARMTVFVASYVAISTVAYLAGSARGNDRGRADYHNELINELDAKGGAPVLLYKAQPNKEETK